MQVAQTTNGTVDPRQLRDALGRFATGVTIITTRTREGKTEGLTANSFSALSLDPPLVLWSIRRTAPSLDSFLSAGAFAVNVLASDQRHLAQHFATPRADKFAEFSCGSGHGKCPVLPGALAIFECETERTVEGGDHLIIIGRVIRAAYGEAEPLIFSRGEYCLPSALAAGSAAPARRRA